MRGRKKFVIPNSVIVDWSKPNGEIAKQLGVSHVTAIKLRKNAGQTPLSRGRRKREVIEAQPITTKS